MPPQTGLLLQHAGAPGEWAHLLQQCRVPIDAVNWQPAGAGLVARLAPALMQAWTPGHDTLQLRRHLGTVDDPSHASVDQEIMIALLAAPTRFEFHDPSALASSIRVRRHIAQATRRTALNFKTSIADRPEALWREDEDHGFVLREGSDLIEALMAATQPDITGRIYGFSCYRATEYVILLGLALELREHHPELYDVLRRRCEQQVIRSGQFHDVFLVEHGSLDHPFPARYYIPGDRVWFRNPDPASSDASGYEGSWVLYMGAGHFGNFWKRDLPYTLDAKCVEIHHWADAIVFDAQGDARIDESRVEALSAQTFSDPVRLKEVLSRMSRLRDPQGIYAEGGCIDASREVPRSVARSHCELVIPPFAPASSG